MSLHGFPFGLLGYKVIDIFMLRFTGLERDKYKFSRGHSINSHTIFFFFYVTLLLMGSLTFHNADNLLSITYIKCQEDVLFKIRW